MMTYRQKQEELRLKSLKIIEDSLNSESPFERFIHAIYFMNAMPNDALDEPIPQFTGVAQDDERGAEVLIDAEDKKP